MFRLWSKIINNNNLIKDYVSCYNDYSISRTTMVLKSLNKACANLDLEVPIWLNTNINEFKKYSKTRFYKDSFIENIDFDYFEIEVIEE